MNKLSIIIPTYNRADLIPFTLDSLLPVHHPGVDYEVIVIDDGSADNTWELVTNSYPDVILLRNEGKGAPAARNTGLRASQGTYILYLDSDDLIGPGYLKGKITWLDEHPDLDAVYGAYDYFASDGAFSAETIIFKHKYPKELGADAAEKHMANYLSGDYVPANTLIWRREILQACKGHREDLALNQDVDLMVRALLNNATIGYHDDGTQVFIRSHIQGERVGILSKKDEQRWRQIFSLRNDFFEEIQGTRFDNAEIRTRFATYLFNCWRSLRNTLPSIADDFLSLAKKVHWPVKIKGGIFFSVLGQIIGPVNAIKVKFMLLKRD